MKRKIIIHIEGEEDDLTVIRCIQSVIKEGKISKTNNIPHYCHYTQFTSYRYSPKYDETREIGVSCICRRQGLNTFYIRSK